MSHQSEENFLKLGYEIIEYVCHWSEINPNTVARESVTL